MVIIHPFLVFLALAFGANGVSTKIKSSGRTSTSKITMKPLFGDDGIKIQKILKTIENPVRRKPSRRLHGAKTHQISEQNLFEQNLAQQIEEDQLKFVADEKNPMKYVVQDGLLFKQSRFSPLARIEIPNSNTKSTKSTKKRRKKQKSNSVFRTNVFRGNINRQIPAIPLPSAFSAAYAKPSFAIRHEADSTCYTNRFGYRCCDPELESLMVRSFEKLRRKGLDTNLAKISATLRRETRQVFAKNFEAIVSSAEFDSSIPTDFSCKVELGAANRLIAHVFVPDLGLDTTVRRHRLPYHELSREDLSESADLVVSRNGILVQRLVQ